MQHRAQQLFPTTARGGESRLARPPRPQSRVAPRLAACLALALVSSVLQVPTTVQAYIPAVPVNDTSKLDSSSDLLHLAFYNGVYNTPISRQLWAEGFDDDGGYTNVSTIVPWTKFSKGVLIHFDESLRDQPPTSVPWIAMISCDTNGTNPSDTDDIFTITRDLGAQAALLYSLTSEGCQITQEYLNTFEKVLDVYATTTLQGSRIIESQFVNVNVAAAGYNSSTLNNSATLIQSLLASNALSVVGNVPMNTTSSVGSTAVAAETSPSVFDPNASSASDSRATHTPTMTMPSLFSDISTAQLRRRQAASTSSSSRAAKSTASTASRTSVAASASATSRLTENYLGAVMAAANLTVGGLNSASATPSAGSSAGNGGPTSTSLAMIILYAITGVVTFLFLIVIMSGAIRAARHPERYGPRTGYGAAGGMGGEGGARTRASGLTRAILDTFPVVRFGNGGQGERRDEEAASGEGGEEGRKKDAAATEGEQVELAVMPSLAPAVPRTNGDETAEVIRPIAAAEGAARPRAASRASTSAESFHSAATTPLTDPQSTASLGGVGPATAGMSASAAAVPAEVAFAVSPSQAAVEATLASAADAAEADLCPICFCDFEDGDELRVLPCDNRHRFHSACIDPFLLNVSRLCPLCRLDLATVAPPQSASAQPGVEGVGEGEGDGERHEEERVIRHLRALLHRGSNSGGPSGSQLAPAAAGADGEGAAAGELEGGARLRSRFAQYIAARRGRARRLPSFSTWAAGDGRMGAPV